MLILPTSDSQRARVLLAQLADDRQHCAIVVFGNTESSREVASRADVRAEGHPFRRVVLVPDPNVLAGDARYQSLLQVHLAGAQAVAVTIDFKISKVLEGAQANDFLALEEAFAGALAGKVATA